MPDKPFCVPSTLDCTSFPFISFNEDSCVGNCYTLTSTAPTGCQCHCDGSTYDCCPNAQTVCPGKGLLTNSLLADSVCMPR